MPARQQRSRTVAEQRAPAPEAVDLGELARLLTSALRDLDATILTGVGQRAVDGRLSLLGALALVWRCSPSQAQTRVYDQPLPGIEPVAAP
jgi:hypothetical protein